VSRVPNANWVEKLVYYYYSINLWMKKLNMFDYEMEIKMVSLAIIQYLLSSCDRLIGIYFLIIYLFGHISNYNFTFNHMLLPSHVI
jgi:hypothetical protein